MHAQSCLTLCNPLDCSPPGSLSMEFSRQEYWSGFPSPGYLPDLGIKPVSLVSPVMLIKQENEQRAFIAVTGIQDILSKLSIFNVKNFFELGNHTQGDVRWGQAKQELGPLDETHFPTRFSFQCKFYFRTECSLTEDGESQSGG